MGAKLNLPENEKLKIVKDVLSKEKKIEYLSTIGISYNTFRKWCMEYGYVGESGTYEQIKIINIPKIKTERDAGAQGMCNDLKDSIERTERFMQELIELFGDGTSISSYKFTETLKMAQHNLNFTITLWNEIRSSTKKKEK